MNNYIEFNYSIYGVKQKKQKYTLLLYFLNDNYPFDRMIIDMEKVQRKEATFEQLHSNSADITTGHDGGILEYDSEMAYFISEHPESPSEPSFEMPLQDLIDVLKEWIHHKKSPKFAKRLN